MSPFSLYAAIAVLAGSMGAAGAWRVQAGRYALKDAARIEQQAEIARNDRKTAQTASEGFEDAQAKNEVEFRTVTKEVEKIIHRPVFRNVCLDADGLRIINSTLGAAGNPGKPQSAVP